MADGETTISPWIPEQDQVRLAALGKLIEECNELSARAARCIIQGIDERDPDTGRTNREELERELADIIAAGNAAGGVFGLKNLEERSANKLRGFHRWFDIIRERAQ